MDNTLLEHLLNEEESNMLDFKSEQYKFVDATKEQKSELLKDIIGFANAWRRSDAYILIGVEEVRGGRSIITGVNDHLDDHSLQEFVNNKTNTPVNFSYEVYNYEGKDIGIIKITKQNRPIWLTKDYGKLKSDQAFIRRGSSTNPNKPATPDELQRMFKTGVLSPSPQLKVELAYHNKDEAFDDNHIWESEQFEEIIFEDIPEFKDKENSHSFGIGRNFTTNISLDEKINPNYYFDYAMYELKRRVYHPVRLVITNISNHSAKDVHLELLVNTDENIFLLEEIDEKPKKYVLRINIPHFDKKDSIFYKNNFSIENNNDYSKCIMSFDNLQPGRKIFSEQFYLLLGNEGENCMKGKIYAENLREPEEFTLKINAQLSRTHLTIQDLIDLAES